MSIHSGAESLTEPIRSSRRVVFLIIGCIALLVISGAGMSELSQASQNSTIPVGSDGQPLKCSPASANERSFAAVCDDDRYFMLDRRWNTDYRHEITKNEFIVRNYVAMHLVDGWSADIDLNSSRVRDSGLLDDFDPEFLSFLDYVPSVAASSPSETVKESQKVAVAGAFPGAGGPVPADAVEIKSNVNEFFTVTDPAKGMGCEFRGSQGGCGILDAATDGRFGRIGLSEDPLWWFPMDGSNEPQLTIKSDAPYFGYPDTQVVPNGASAYYQDFVCGVNDAGMTCWNVKSGHGVLMSKDKFTTF